jgi:chemotaxis protein MotB
MTRRKKHPAHENHERWLVSYADFMTLLFAFFVVMFASSQTDRAKAQQISDSVKEALEKGGVKAVVHEILGGTVDNTGKGNAQMRGPGGAQKSTENPQDKKMIAELLPSMESLSMQLKEEIKSGKVQISLTPRGLVISLRQATFFPSGEDAIDPVTYPVIEKIAETTAKLPNSVRLEGHTDAIPIHTARFRSNWELSAARSIAVMEILATRFNVPRDRLAIAGYADTAPLAANDTPENRAKNRRVDVVILSQLRITDQPQQAHPAPRGSEAHK